MPTHEIPRTSWGQFFDEFSHTHTGTLITIEVVNGPQTDPAFEARRLPLVGISYDPRGGGAGQIEIMAGLEGAGQLTHVITQPVRVYHKEGAGLISDEINQDEILEITSAAPPPITYLRFQRPAQ